jgi:dynein light chain roadblock-type
LKRLQAHKGVQGVVIVNSDGIPIRSTLTDSTSTVQHAALLTQLIAKARSVVRELDPAVCFIYFDLNVNLCVYIE